MKTRTPRLTKFKRLRRRLKLRVYECVGLLETLWWVVGQNTPQGDIGRLSDDDLAEEIDYGGEPIELVGALLEERWLCRSAKHRLVVHDWPEHAPYWVRGNLSRASLPLLDCGHSNERSNEGASSDAEHTSNDVSNERSNEPSRMVGSILTSAPSYAVAEDSVPSCSVELGRASARGVHQPSATDSDSEPRPLGERKQPGTGGEAEERRQEQVRLSVRRDVGSGPYVQHWLSRCLDNGLCFANTTEAKADFEAFRLERKQAEVSS